MARYTGPKTKKARAFGEAIYGYDKSFERKKYRPGQHGNSRRRRQQSPILAIRLFDPILLQWLFFSRAFVVVSHHQSISFLYAGPHRHER